MDAAEVNQVLPEIPLLGDLVKSLYECHYDKFFVALGMCFTSALKPCLTVAKHILSKTRARTSYPISCPIAACTLLRERDADTRLHTVTRIVPQPDTRQPRRCIRRQR